MHLIHVTSVDCYEHFTQKKKISDQAEKLIEAHHVNGCKLQNDTYTKLCKTLRSPSSSANEIAMHPCDIYTLTRTVGDKPQ